MSQTSVWVVEGSGKEHTTDYSLAYGISFYLYLGMLNQFIYLFLSYFISFYLGLGYYFSWEKRVIFLKCATRIKIKPKLWLIVLLKVLIPYQAMCSMFIKSCLKTDGGVALLWPYTTQNKKSSQQQRRWEYLCRRLQ